VIVNCGKNTLHSVKVNRVTLLLRQLKSEDKALALGKGISYRIFSCQSFEELYLLLYLWEPRKQ
jgi:hypothetical protein